MSEAAWPRPLSGVVESVVTTGQPDGTWNVAALGLHGRDDHEPTEPVDARTWGDTRTRRNFEREAAGYVQFVDDPVAFVDAALDRWTREEPILEAASAWVEVAASVTDEGRADGTRWVDWTLAPRDAEVRRRVVPITSRAPGAIVEMTVAASRLGVDAYDTEELHERLDYFADVATRCGGPGERAAVDRVAELSDWSWGGGAR